MGKHTFTLEATVPFEGINWESGLISYLGYGPDQWECYVSPGTTLRVTRVWKDGVEVAWNPRDVNSGSRHYGVWEE